MRKSTARRSRARIAIPTALATAAVTVLVAVSGIGTAANTVAPSNQSPPTISGTAQSGQTLTSSTGTWSGTEPITYSYQWRRCDRSGGSCSSIGGATQKTYDVKGVDVGNTLRVRVTAKNADGSKSATSVPTAVVQRAAPNPGPTARGCPSGTGPVRVEQVSLPARLNVDRFTVNPSPVGGSTRTIVAGFHVSDTCNQSVQGALVYATVVPYNQFSVPAEQPTDGAGNVQLTMSRLAGFPAARNQQLLVVFVRARKSGENLLGGISTRRLVSVGVDLRR